MTGAGPPPSTDSLTQLRRCHTLRVELREIPAHDKRGGMEVATREIHRTVFQEVTGRETVCFSCGGR